MFLLHAFYLNLFTESGWDWGWGWGGGLLGKVFISFIYSAFLSD